MFGPLFEALLDFREDDISFVKGGYSRRSQKLSAAGRNLRWKVKSTDETVHCAKWIARWCFESQETIKLADVSRVGRRLSLLMFRESGDD
jgi:hypothetical protein